MSRRSDRAAERQAVKQAEKDLKQAGAAARKAFDLKDPRFLAEAAVAASRGPAGLAMFGASRGIQVIRDRRAAQAEILGELAADAKKHAEALKEKTSVTAAPTEKRSPLRRFAPLWIIGLAGGAAVAGATAYFLRDQGSPAPAPAPAPTPSPTAPTSTTSAGSAEAADAPATGEDVTIDAADPEGPADQKADPAPAAGDSASGASADGEDAGSAPGAGSAPASTGGE